MADLTLPTVASAKLPMLATMDGDQPRLRPVSTVRPESFAIHIANLRSYDKNRQIAANAKIGLCDLADNHDQVRITGKATILTGSALLESIWKAIPLLRYYLGFLDNSELITCRVPPNRVRFMREWAPPYFEAPVA